MQFDNNKMNENLKIKEEQMSYQISNQMNKLRDQFKIEAQKNENKFVEFSDKIQG